MDETQMKSRMAKLEEDMQALQKVEGSLRQELQDLEVANQELEAQVHAHNQELEAQLDLFRRFVPQMLIRTLHSRGFNVEEGLSQEQAFSVFSCDIRNFTTFSESITCTECFRFLHSFFAVVEPGIRETGGFVYQYVGDEIMALFPLIDEHYADNAVQAAVQIQNEIMPEYNAGRLRAGYDPIQIGVGINTGIVATGIAGTPERMDACAFGNTVNLAARCEQLTKEYDVPIVITSDTVDKMAHPEAFQLQSLGETPIRGLEKRIALFGVFPK